MQDGDIQFSTIDRQMARYYFDIHDSDGAHRDEVGDNFETFEEARAQAQILLPDIAREELPDGELHQVSCEVRDAADRVVYRGRLTFEGSRFTPEEPVGA